ncbi:MAG: MarR family winged helix-turn-helix transcriptional regulator [Armatimonadota bacterium]|nr:MarR family winged helix-turn-helix transcriptional regulator [Armatimonadota bacterium]MDW8155713.1 MarR family winged helix-turn-helix transcriptional regulator [Armatimonadota bacterium]
MRGGPRRAGPFEDRERTAERVAQAIVRIGTALRSEAWEGALARGLTPTQAQILSYLRFRGREGARVSEVAEALAVTPATASESTDALVRKGLVRKVRAAEDGRARQVVLTAAGRREARRLAGWPDFLLQAVRSLPAGEQAALLRVLLKTIRELQNAGRIPTSRMCVTCRYFRPYAHPDPAAPHHCDFVDAPFGDGLLRVDCPDHVPAAPQQEAENWRRFAGV